MRGNNRQMIFEDESDYCSFLEILEQYKNQCNFEIYAYCLMSNHVHLLMRFNGESISSSVKKVAEKYSYYFNKKYDRCGHLFQDRFKSEPIEDKSYLLSVFRYIIQNPLKSGIPHPFDYPWSSYSAYRNDISDVTDIAFMSLFFNNQDDLIAFLNQKNSDCCMEYMSAKCDDAYALNVLKSISNCSSISEFNKLNLQDRNLYLTILSKTGISISQMSRITGISRPIIRNAIKEI